MGRHQVYLFCSAPLPHVQTPGTKYRETLERLEGTLFEWWGISVDVLRVTVFGNCTIPLLRNIINPPQTPCQVIQAVAFISPIVGGHKEPLKGSHFHHPKKDTSRIARWFLKHTISLFQLVK